MSHEQRTPVLLVCCGSLNPVTIGHLKMFEIARNFMERIGTHTVVGGVLSPVHDGYRKPGLLPAKHRLEMCRLAVQRYPWLSVDSWESEQPEWVETIKVLRHQAEQIKDLYGVEYVPKSGSQSPYSPTQTAVTLQPGANGLVHFPISYPVRSSASGQGSVPSMYNFDRRASRHPSVYDLIDRNESLELNEASEPSLHDKTGIVLDKLGQNLKRMCCARPTAFDVPHHSNMVYGATCDFRRMKVMLLCGGDLLESFAKPGLWEEEDIREIVSDFGIVCIPRHQIEERESTFSVTCGMAARKPTPDDRADRMRSALDRLHDVTKHISGTIILVNDIENPEISHISSTKCRKALKCGSPDAGALLIPSVLNYIQRNNLYTAEVAA